MAAGTTKPFIYKGYGVNKLIFGITGTEEPIARGLMLTKAEKNLLTEVLNLPGYHVVNKQVISRSGKLKGAILSSVSEY